jgi:cobalt-zinc-cadmium resistance protein CzcA
LARCCDKIYGEDLDKLAQYVNRLVLFRNIVGAQDIYVEQVSGLPQLVIKFHRKMAQFGFEHIEDVNTAIRSGFAGEVVCV